MYILSEKATLCILTIKGKYGGGHQTYSVSLNVYCGLPINNKYFFLFCIKANELKLVS